MIEIGAVNIDISHPLAFADYLKKNGKRACYTAVYNDSFRDEDEVNAFIEKRGLKQRFFSLDEMADNVDIGFIHSCNWDNHIDLALPFIKKNKPVFIDKPIVGSLADCRRIEQLAEEGAVILGSSSVRYCEEIQDFASKSEDEIGKILHIYGTAGVDEFNYAIHVVEALGPLVKSNATDAAFTGRSCSDGKICETFFVNFENGITATFNTFQGTWQPFEIVITTTKGTHQFRIDTTKIYGALLDRICDYMETGNNSMASVKELTESIKIMLAARLSRQAGGGTFKIAEIPDNDPGYNGTKFAQEYAQATPRKMYQEK